MAEYQGPLSECPPCGADAILPLMQALTVGSWKTADSGGDGPACGSSQSPPTPSEVFSTRRPRDAIAGAASGLKTATRSVTAGMVALACCPMEGARKDGTAGALRGLGEGLATAMLLPCAGALVAAVQAARGVANTPQALAESLRGLEWNQKERCWATPSYSLAEEARQIQHQRAGEADAACGAGSAASASSSRGGSGRGSRRCVDPRRTVQRHGKGYYEILRVQPTASCTELRRAYYRESRRCHPDKVGADPRAVAHFQQLSEAYKVLRSPELRHAYDLGGCEEVARQSATIDLGALYAAALGGARWEPHLGRLALTRILAQDFGEEADDDAAWDVLSSLWWAGDDARDPCQVEREVQCAATLAERLQLAVGGDLAAFERVIHEEARRLAEVPFAPGLLHAMACVYESEAACFLSAFRVLDLRREAAEARSQGRLLVRQASAAAAGVRAVLVLQSLLQEESPRGSSAESRGKEEPRATALCLERPSVQAQLPLLAQALWRLTLLDVEGTLRRACRRVLRDGAAELADRVRRAEAMQLLAEAFREAADARAGAATAGAPGEDEQLLREHVRETAARLANGHAGDEEPAGSGAAASACG